MRTVVICICAGALLFGAGYATAKYKHRSNVKKKISETILLLNYEANEKLQERVDALHLDDADDERLSAVSDSLAREFERRWPSAVDTAKKTN